MSTFDSRLYTTPMGRCVPTLFLTMKLVLIVLSVLHLVTSEAFDLARRALVAGSTTTDGARGHKSAAVLPRNILLGRRLVRRVETATDTDTDEHGNGQGTIHGTGHETSRKDTAEPLSPPLERMRSYVPHSSSRSLLSSYPSASGLHSHLSGVTTSQRSLLSSHRSGHRLSSQQSLHSLQSRA